jgi:hypothetical protein
MNYSTKERVVFGIGLDSLYSQLHALDLRWELETDFSQLAKFLSEQNSFVNPTYSTEHSDLGREDFWIRLLDNTGRTVACSAERTVETANFVDMVAEGTCWYRNGFADIGQAGRIETLPVSEHLGGKIGLSGSTFTLPEWRRHGLALIMTWLTRLISFREFGTEINTGFVRHSLAQTSVPGQSYAYDHVEPIINGYFPPQRGQEHLYLCWIDRVGMMRRVLDLPRHPTNPMRLCAGAQGCLRSAGSRRSAVKDLPGHLRARREWQCQNRSAHQQVGQIKPEHGGGESDGARRQQPACGARAWRHCGCCQR